MGSNCVLGGNGKKVALPPSMMPNTSAQDAEQPLTEPRSVLERRKQVPLTPYKAEAWARKLRRAGVIECFINIPDGLRLGFNIDFPSISIVQTPLNKESIAEYTAKFNSIIQKELDKGRYIGPLTADTLEKLIGPFQSSPMPINPKPGKPGKFRVIQNFSFPLSLSTPHPNHSINSYINAQDFPTTWGKLSIIYNLIAHLPPGSEAAISDVAEAY
jgi:hypothetical protein